MRVNRCPHSPDVGRLRGALPQGRAYRKREHEAPLHAEDCYQWSMPPSTSIGVPPRASRFSGRSWGLLHTGAIRRGRTRVGSTQPATMRSPRARPRWKIPTRHPLCQPRSHRARFLLFEHFPDASFRPVHPFGAFLIATCSTSRFSIGKPGWATWLSSFSDMSRRVWILLEPGD